MATVEYVRALGEGARKRHSHVTSRGEVVVFVVQLEVQFRGTWLPVVRYDMAHGKAHVDVYETPRRKRKQFLGLPPGEVLTLAEEDIRDNWERYQEEFLRRNSP
jgi:hypothetical protein